MHLELLMSQAEFEAWKDENIYPFAGDVASQPIEFPCYARTIVQSWNLEEESAVYLYREDIEKMLAAKMPGI